MNIHIVLKIFKQKTFGGDIYESNIVLEEADEYQKDLLLEIMSFKNNSKPRSKEKKKKNKKKKLFLKS